MDILTSGLDVADPRVIHGGVQVRLQVDVIVLEDVALLLGREF